MTENPDDRRTRRGYAIMAILLLIALAIFNIDVIADHFRGYIDVVALVPETGGVRVGSPVVVEGVEAGRVTGLGFAGGEQPAVALHLRLHDRVRPVVRHGSRASTAKRRFIGEPMVLLSAGPTDAPGLVDGDTLFASDRPSLAVLIERASAFPAALDSLTGAMGRLEELANQRRPGFDVLADRFVVLTTETDRFRQDLDNGSLGQLLDDATLDRRIRRLRDHARELGRTAGRMGPSMEGNAELREGLERLERRADHLDAALDGLATSLRHGDGILARVQADSALLVAIAGVRAQIDSLRADGMGFALRMILP